MPMLVVKELSEGKAKDGKRFWKVVAEDGGVLYCWDSRVAQGLQVGGCYEAAIEERGKFRRLTEARPVASANGLAPGEKGEGEAPVTVRLVLTLDMEALQEAVDLLAELIRKARG